MSEEWPDGAAVVVGFEDYGRVPLIARYLRRYGYRDVFVVTNRASALRSMPSGLFIVVEVPDILNPTSLADAVVKIPDFDIQTSPFLCVQDRVVLSYLEARELLLKGRSTRFFVDAAGMRAARLKPLARASWNRAGVDPTRWGLVDEGMSGEAVSRHLQAAGLEKVLCIVKPAVGMGSEAVTPRPVLGANAIGQAARDVFKYWDTAIPAEYLNVHLRAGDYDLALYRQALVEEYLDGPEFTVDGLIRGDEIWAAVQHKETRYLGKFVGDGLIVSPPAAAPGNAAVPHAYLQRAGHTATPVDEFVTFLQRGLQALGFTHWVFHAEVISTASGLRFVELNPRPPGGLLARTANVHLGIDLFEALVRIHLGIETLPASRDAVTGQFPIYAEQVGTVISIDGIEHARQIPGVDRIEVAVDLPCPISSLDQENYLVFVALRGRSHAEIRGAEERVRGAISVRYGSIQ